MLVVCLLSVRSAPSGETAFYRPSVGRRGESWVTSGVIRIPPNCFGAALTFADGRDLDFAGRDGAWVTLNDNNNAEVEEYLTSRRGQVCGP